MNAFAVIALVGLFLIGSVLAAYRLAQWLNRHDKPVDRTRIKDWDEDETD